MTISFQKFGGQDNWISKNKKEEQKLLISTKKKEKQSMSVDFYTPYHLYKTFELDQKREKKNRNF